MILSAHLQNDLSQKILNVLKNHFYKTIQNDLWLKLQYVLKVLKNQCYEVYVCVYVCFEYL